MRNEKKNLFSKMDQLKTESGFRLPEGYFDTLPSKISDKIISRQNVTEKQGNWIGLLRPQLALVALFAGVAVLGYFSLNFFSGDYSTRGITEESISEYLSYYYPSSGDYDFIEYVEEDQFLEMFDDALDEENGEIIDYLIFMDIDLQTILEEF
jgi:hypothetical protein